MTDATLLNRALHQFRRALRLPGGSRQATLQEQVSGDLKDHELPAIRAHIDACLEARGGEVSARARAAQLGELYLTMSAAGRTRFLTLLAVDYDVDAQQVEALIDKWRSSEGNTERWRVQDRLRRTLVPPRVALLRQFNGLAEGVKFLVDLRAELMRVAGEHKPMRALDRDLRELLASWFDVGFLDLRRITWDTSAALLEKLIAYEAVHAIRSWDDLKNRLGDDRRCYAFFHPRMPDEPLIFVQVALTKGMAHNVNELLDEAAPVEDPREADSAIFYSISNCQPGLAGVSFGNFLIKRVASDLKRDLPNLKTFATLSPIPGFRRWLQSQLDAGLDDLSETEPPPVLTELAGGHDWPAVLRSSLDGPEWAANANAAAALAPVLTRQCARYLLEAKRGTGTLDRVAHFHLSNGARIERINWLGDTSEPGMQRSAGLMVNYLYDLDEVERNHEAYTGEGRVATSAQVAKLLR